MFASAANATPFAGVATDRVIVAVAPLDFMAGDARQNLERGEFFVFGPGDTYQLPAHASFFEVAIKPDHPPVKEPPEIIPPAKNTLLYEGERFFIYEESLNVGDVRPRHSHCQRVEIRLNNGPMLEQTFDPPRPPMQPGIVNWREPVIHTVRNVGDMPLRNLIVEFKPRTAMIGRAAGRRRRLSPSARRAPGRRRQTIRPARSRSITNMSMSRAATPCADAARRGCKDRVIVGYGRRCRREDHRGLRKTDAPACVKSDQVGMS